MNLVTHPPTHPYIKSRVPHHYDSFCDKLLRVYYLFAMAMADLIGTKCRQLKYSVYDRVTEQSRKGGEKRYSNWASKNYRWEQSDYNDRGFRAAYFNRLFETRAGLVHEVLDYCDSDHLPNFLDKTNLKVVSFGCGPGCDLLGFQQFYQQKKKQRITELENRVKKKQASAQQNLRHRRSIDETRSMIQEIRNAKVSYIGYDSSSGWMEYVRRLDYTFQEQQIDKRFVDGMEPVDVAILCYFAHAADLQQRSKSSFWESLQRKCKVVLALDTMYNKKEFNGMLTKLGFKELDVGLKDEREKEVYTTLWTATRN